MEHLYWLHVPLETTRGDWLKAPDNGRLQVLGRPARLLERTLPRQDTLTSTSTAVVRQWLLFDPLSEGDARSILSELRARFPVLSHKQSAALRVGASALHIAEHAIYNGPIPTLIPAHLKPDPAWAELQMTSYLDGRDVLERSLIQCVPVADDRLLAALDLSVASRYDVLPRSIFLAQLTILDALAERVERPKSIKAWLDEKIMEARALGDLGLISSLANLKQGSHGAAVRSLVARAAMAKGLNAERTKELSDLAGKLYAVRSGLSHAGAAQQLDVAGAQQLVKLVLDAAVANPRVLDPSPQALA